MRNMNFASLILIFKRATKTKTVLQVALQKSFKILIFDEFQSLMTYEVSCELALLLDVCLWRNAFKITRSCIDKHIKLVWELNKIFVFSYRPIFKVSVSHWRKKVYSQRPQTKRRWDFFGNYTGRTRYALVCSFLPSWGKKSGERRISFCGQYLITR